MKDEKFEAQARGVTYIVQVSKCAPSPSTQTADMKRWPHDF